MLLQEVQEHAAGAAKGGFNAGETIIEHISNPHADPIIHLPTVMGIDFSVTKHVFMLWLVAAAVFIVVTWLVRRYLRQDRLVPSGAMNGLEAVVEFVRDSIVQPNVGQWAGEVHRDAPGDVHVRMVGGQQEPRLPRVRRPGAEQRPSYPSPSGRRAR